ncbi:haloacid dehalogenase type II [Haloechinothrix salitolerans]|uniref:Haloacid dehalogenase type II n=1 Tax=Haloechinothrix salitolerans TaxID=926830 RepID=A0ABW2BSS5_9PSEU
MRTRPSVVAFDVVETLMALEPLASRFADIGLSETTLRRWFDRLIRDGMALTLAGDYLPFPELASEALHGISERDLDEASVRHVLEGFAELPAHPDAEPAMRELADAGVEMVCLSNGAARTTDDFVARTGLDPYISQVISVAEVERWKPAREVYEHALHRIGAPADRVALVAVHAWDCHGASKVGLTTGWASRLERVHPRAFAQPDVTGTDLVDVARGLLALPQS